MLVVQIPMDWILMHQFHRNLKIHSNLIFRLKCVGLRHLLYFIQTTTLVFLCFTIICFA
jgi:hypothetical protein